MSGLIPRFDGLTLDELVDLMGRDPIEPDISPAVYYEEVALDLLRHGPAGRDAVLARLEDSDPARRAAAIAALSGERSAHAELTVVAIRALDDPDPRVVMTAVDALRHLERRDLRPRIAALWDHASPLVRGAVVRFLAGETDETSPEIVRAGLTDADPIVRQSAADALADAGVIDAIADVRALEDDPDPNVRLAAQTAVASLMAQASETGA